MIKNPEEDGERHQGALEDEQDRHDAPLLAATGRDERCVTRQQHNCCEPKLAVPVRCRSRETANHSW
jgi:hypothetical protein